MALPPIWPASLPQTPRRGAWVGGPTEARVQFEAEYGPPIERARTTADMEVYSATYPNLSNAARAAFMAFFAGDLGRGVNRFAMRDPVTQDLGLWKVLGDGRQPYVLTAKQAGWNDLTLTLMKMPGAIWYAPYATATGDLRLPYVVADYENGVFGVDGVRTTAAAVAAVTGQFDLYTTATGGAVTEELDHSVFAGDVPATAPGGVAKIVGYRLGDLVDPYAAFTAAYDFGNAAGSTLSGSEILTAPNLAPGGSGYDLAALSAGARFDLVSGQAVSAVGDAMVNIGGDLGTLARTHAVQMIYDGEVTNIANNPILFSFQPTSGNGRLMVYVTAAGRVRVEARNAANVVILNVEAATTIADNARFKLSVSLELNQIWVDWGAYSGGTVVTSPILSGAAADLSGQDVSYNNACIGGYLPNGALHANNRAALKINSMSFSGL
ncbi:hypothetical protein OEW28_18625 [Defluviimonas sp. WL0002]|uniref:Phage tail protein n=1 Tax=Albidovulum marisflavi TaxID=2984159 RepID=A0ABT2ZHL5_9RHOB|nr:hypothetical protein [Defluviimonas sp. WL0002]MCV2870632.1 hypothetical protein [Defluviimonas sp. WL0002]